MKNYVGEKFGNFKVLEQKRKNNITYLYCVCKKCGKKRWYTKSYINKAKCCKRKGSQLETKELYREGMKINDILLLEKTSQRVSTRMPFQKSKRVNVWKCKDEYGNIFYTTIERIKDNEIANLKDNKEEKNKLKYNKKDLREKRFGRLTVIEETDKRQDNGSIVWKCRCDCGNIIEVSSKRLINNINVSCGCYQKERQNYSMNKLHKKQLQQNTNIDLIRKKEANSNNKTSGVRGVHYCKSKKRWIATLNFQKKLVLNKTFKEKKDAIKARKEAEQKYFKPILDEHVKSYNITKIEMVRNIYKDYLREDDKTKIVIKLDVFKKYFENEKIEKKIKELDKMLIDRFRMNHYTVYEEGKYYKEEDKKIKVRKGTAVAIKK